MELNTDTPLPPEEPAGKNPPDGAIINYYLKSTATGAGDAGDLRRQGQAGAPLFQRRQGARTVDENTLTIPSYWIRPPQILSAKAGSHRFVWDLRFASPKGALRKRRLFHGGDLPGHAPSPGPAGDCRDSTR